MQEAEKACKSDNYFDTVTRSTNTLPVPKNLNPKPTALDQDQKDTVKKFTQLKQHM